MEMYQDKHPSRCLRFLWLIFCDVGNSLAQWRKAIAGNARTMKGSSFITKEEFPDCTHCNTHHG